jgi:flagellar motility protein MotE (MotC chaperone)
MNTLSLTPSKPSSLTFYLSIVPVLLLLALSPTLFHPSLLKAQEETDDQKFSSVEERRLFNSIQSERASIREEKKELELRKKELKSIESGVDKKLVEIDSKLEELKALRTQIETLLTAKSVEEKKRTQDLAKIYEKMTPEKAALALSGLRPQLASDLLASMKVKSAARILDQISRQKATELSTTFSTIQLE